MSQCSLIINVSPNEHMHNSGLGGHFTVPAKPLDLPFALLVVYPTPEIQDIGDGRKTVHWVKARSRAIDIVGAAVMRDGKQVGKNAEYNRQKFGILLCDAEPDFPRALEKAMEAEGEYLNLNPLDHRYHKDQETGAMVIRNIYPEGAREQREKLSQEVVKQRDIFHEQCRELVTSEEVSRAQNAMNTEYARLVALGDRLWARPQDHKDISDLHRRACIALGQERPWCYIPQQLVDCEFCGSKIKQNIAICPQCGGILDREKAIRGGLIDADSPAGTSIQSKAKRGPGRPRKETTE